MERETGGGGRWEGDVFERFGPRFLESGGKQSELVSRLVGWYGVVVGNAETRKTETETKTMIRDGWAWKDEWKEELAE